MAGGVDVRPELGESIELLRKGDPASAQHALEILQRTLLSFGYKVCGHREDAEDTAQEVLLKALPHLAKLDDPRALSVWLYTAMKNRCWQGRRTAAYQKTVALEQLMPDRSEWKELALADPAASPEVRAESRQNQQLLHQVVLNLPAPYRLVLVLHDMEELDTDLVAKILSLQPGTVRVRLHRARLLVRQEMSRRLRGAGDRPRKKEEPAKRPAQCRELFANLSEYLDGRLVPESGERLRAHIEACPACVAFIEDLKRAIDRCRSFDLCPEAEALPVLRRLLTQEYLRLKNSPTRL